MGAGAKDIAHNKSLMSPMAQEGYEGDTVTQKSNASSGIRLNTASALENTASGDLASQYNAIKELLGRGPGAEAVDDYNIENKNFINMMQNINANGGLPDAEDTRRANVYADSLFAPQQEALNQSYEYAQQDAAKLAAKLNRPINDPIIQAKLQQEKMRQGALLNADRSAFVAQEARNSPFQRLALQGQLADAKGSLASQAMANRMQLLNLGNSLQQQERDWRLKTSEKYMNGEQSQHSGGGLQGATAAVTGTVGSFMSMFSAIYSGGAMGKSGYDERQPASFSGQPATQSGGYASEGGYNSQYLGSGLGTSGNSSPYSASQPRQSRLKSSGTANGANMGSAISSFKGAGASGGW